MRETIDDVKEEDEPGTARKVLLSIKDLAKILSFLNLLDLPEEKSSTRLLKL